jgi:RimJ/RimL family protein N-acetyltransferase
VFTVRRMSAADKPAVLAISSQIWEGRDYLPRVFDEWVRDAEGEFAAVLLEGRVVGCGELTWFTPVDAWLEGLRKDPAVKDKGLGGTLARYFFAKLAARPDLASLRFSTRSTNHASITVNEALGFQRRMTLTRMSWEGSRAELAAVPTTSAGAVEVRSITDESLVHDFLVRYGCFRDTAGLVVDGWQARPFSPEMLAERYVKAGRCRGVIAPEGLAGLVIDRFDERALYPRLKVVCLDARDAAIADALFDDVFLTLRRAAGRHGPAAPDRLDVEWMVPPADRLRRWCAGRGLRAEREDDVVIFEYPLERLRGGSA